MYLLASVIAFVVFCTNVAMGSMGNPFLGDVGEMLVLLTASVFFVVAILIKETNHIKNTGE